MLKGGDATISNRLLILKHSIEIYQILTESLSLEVVFAPPIFFSRKLTYYVFNLTCNMLILGEHFLAATSPYTLNRKKWNFHNFFSNKYSIAPPIFYSYHLKGVFPFISDCQSIRLNYITQPFIFGILLHLGVSFRAYWIQAFHKSTSCLQAYFYFVLIFLYYCFRICMQNNFYLDTFLSKQGILSKQ